MRHRLMPRTTSCTDSGREMGPASRRCPAAGASPSVGSFPPCPSRAGRWGASGRTTGAWTVATWSQCMGSPVRAPPSIRRLSRTRWHGRGRGGGKPAGEKASGHCSARGTAPHTHHFGRRRRAGDLRRGQRHAQRQSNRQHPCQQLSAIVRSLPGGAARATSAPTNENTEWTPGGARGRGPRRPAAARRAAERTPHGGGGGAWPRPRPGPLVSANTEPK